MTAPAVPSAPGGILWAYAFRPFFLLACLYGAVVTLGWGVMLSLGMEAPGPMPASQWHAHEMLMGFAGAALGGFILTAVPSWTATGPVVGGRLMLLAAVWGTGRLAMWGAGVLPPWMAAAPNLAFPILLLAWVTPPILADSGARHRAFPPVLGLLTAALAICHWGWAAGDPLLAARGLEAMLILFVLLIVLTVSRITMVVINAALEEVGAAHRFRPNPARGTLAWVTVAHYAAAEFSAPDSAVTGWVALAAAAAQLDRLTDWHIGRAILRPYVLVLYAVYWWIAIGLALIGIHHVFGLVPASSGRHALGLGAAGGAILAVFVIAGMRHTGRALAVPPLGALAFALVNVAALVRVATPILAPQWYVSVGLGLSSALFVAALLAYLLAFVPKLLRPRVDGKPG